MTRSNALRPFLAATCGLLALATSPSATAQFGNGFEAVPGIEACPPSADLPPPAVSLQASRGSGKSPMAVFFDATATQSPGIDAFRELEYHFNFNDDRDETWPLSGQSRNTQTGGPIAAHVYDQPGTYVAAVGATAPDGSRGLAIATLYVEHADAHYVGERTVCISGADDFEGCPSDAVRLDALPAALLDRRILLRRGESFGALTLNREDDGVTVGAFGSGPMPQVDQITIGPGRPQTAEFPDDITIMDLQVLNGIEQVGSASRLLIYRNQLDGPGSLANNSIRFASALDYWSLNDPMQIVPTDQFYHPHEIFIIDNLVVGTTQEDEAPLANLIGSASQLAIVGNDMGGADEHTIRVYRTHKAFMAHNALRGMSHDGNRHSLKLHSGGFGDYDHNIGVSGNTYATRQVVIANNLMGDNADNNAWTVVVAPQNAGPESGEGIEDVIVENNQFIRGSRTSSDLVLVARRVTARGNVRVDLGELVINTRDGVDYPMLPPQWRGPYFFD